MATITISYTQQVQQSKEVELPVFITYAGGFYKVVSADTFIQVIAESATGETTIKKWKNAGTVTRFLTDAAYTPCDEDDFRQAYQTALNSIADNVDEGNI